jgi:glucose/arabinose dehydrogenase
MIRLLVVICLLCSPFELVAQDTPLNTSPLPLEMQRAFPNMRFNRPIVLASLPQEPGQLYVCSQLGKIHRAKISSDLTEEQLELFLDWESHVTYKDKQNEEGLLGFAFHPKFAENGQFFLHYTSADLPAHTSVVARFRVKKDNPRQADPASHEEIRRIPQPFWNHNGGGLAFGPDGYLYIALGDGGKGNDPLGNGQNLWQWLGSILRIDIDHHDIGKKYAIPKDNPFVDRKDAQPEIYAHGFRNIWGLSFDAAGQLWAADVGQDFWEEINLVSRGGNYGWSKREGKHKFLEAGYEARPELIDPIWEYDHEAGKSITGGVVYAGKQHAELAGHYVYADYVSGKVWALKYDAAQKRVVANRSIADKKMPIICIAADSAGEIYLSDAFGQIWTLGKVK